MGQNLIGVDEYNFSEIHREKYVQEKNLVPPNDTLLFLLVVQPDRPLVRH